MLLTLTVAVMMFGIGIGIAAASPNPAAVTIVKKYRGHGAEYWHYQMIREQKHERALLSRHLALRKRLANPYLTRPPHYSEWMCIHGGEGSWTANTGNGYYGGMQMDYGFMRSYGAKLLATKGTADRWTPLEQMWVAEKAWTAGRGFYPWPTTARNCGLI